MILEFVPIKEGLWDMFNNFLRKKVKEKTMVLQGITNKTQIHEGRGYSFDVSGVKQDMKMKVASGSFQIKKEEQSNLSLAEITKRIEGVAEEMAGQMERGLIEVLNNTTGITSEANAKPLNHETLLEHMEKIDIGFYDDNPMKPHELSLITAPGMEKELQRQWDNMSEEAQGKIEQRRKIIYAKKYEEYSTREQRRKLVD
ncbi:hypothetical protein KAI58_00965 [Candidatus Gracilibacteria bacterium]|nr:hypothetical protein [Candidatus Gracilibacteria bacterium]